MDHVDLIEKNFYVCHYAYVSPMGTLPRPSLLVISIYRKPAKRNGAPYGCNYSFIK